MPQLLAPTREMIAENLKLRARCPWYTYFATPESRKGYAKHVAFMAAGKEYRQRLFLSANRSGKTATAAFEMVCHLTGAYPAWWEGRKFEGPIEAWAGGDTGQTVRDIIQVALLGPVATMETRDWCGMIPKPAVYDVTRRPGLPGAASAIYVSRLDGEVSVLGLLSYDQGRETWQGTAKHVIWPDEEPPDDIYGEALMRTMTTGGILMVTMTPLKGLTPFVGDWLRRSVLEVINPETGLSELRHAHSAVFAQDADQPDGESAIAPEELSRYTVMASWDDCPHLGEAVKAEMAKECPPHLLDARRSGVPSLGSGTIYPIPESEIRVKPFEIPDHWPRCWGADTDSGAGWTAAVWLAWDRESNVYYVYDGFKRRHAEPAVHVAAVKARGAWIPGVADAAGLAVTIKDSQQVIALWRAGGLDVTLPDKSVEAGIQEMWELFSGGRLRVFASLGFLFDEYRLYRRDDKGRVVKKDDHCLHPSTRVLTMDGYVALLDLVDTTGYAVGHDGAMVRFGSVRKTRTDAEMVTVRFDDGSAITCTPDHRFWTTTGWVEAAQMRGAVCLNAAVQRQERQRCLSDLAKRFRCIAGLDTTYVGLTTNGTACDFTAAYGKTNMVVPYQPDGTFTTSTATGATTIRATSRSWHETRTCRTIKSVAQNVSHEKPSKPRGLGTLVQQAWNGTENTTPRWARPCTESRNARAITAASGTPRMPEPTSSTALARAVRLAVARVGWITRNVFARYVARASWSIVTRKRPPVRANAQARCTAVKRADKSDAYCLEVYGTHGFAVEGGVVVSNCMDALRYSVKSGRSRMKTKPGAPKEPVGNIFADPKTAGSGWMGA